MLDMSLTKAIKALRIGEHLTLDISKRNAVYVTAKRLGIEIEVERNGNDIVVTRLGDSLDFLIASVKDLPVAQRLTLFSQFETCCGMNRGSCVCPVSPSMEPESVAPVITGEWIEDPKLGGMNTKLAALLSQSPKLVEAPTETVWEFTRDAPQYADNGNCYRSQYDVANPKRRRTVQVDPDTHLPLDN